VYKRKRGLHAWEKDKVLGLVAEKIAPRENRSVEGSDKESKGK